MSPKSSALHAVQRRARAALSAVVPGLLLLLLAACASEKAVTPPSGECTGADDLESCLPAWGAFAPAQADVAPAPSGAPLVREEVGDLERIDDTGATVTTPNVTFSCTEQTYSFVDNPEKAMSFNIDETVIWPGSLVQGRTHRDAQSIGGVLQLPVVERAPLSLTLSFNNANNTQVVAAPAYGSVSSALGAMIGGAQAEGLATASNIDYLSRTYSSERQAALSFGVSGRYLTFEAKASGSLNRRTTTNTVAAKFVQQMYIAGVSQPPTPAAFFSDGFTPAKYEEQAALGRIGADNPPLYVSRIGYGRMMVFAMTAEAEATEIQAALSAAYEVTGAGNVEAELSAKHKAILETAEIRITQVGGDQTNALNAIRTGKLADYFTNTAPLTAAAPIWFELKTLTGEVAMVSETGTYTESTCVPRLPGLFEFQPEIALSIPFTAGTQRQVLSADVNADGRMDLVYNERRSTASMNRVHVALGAAGGGFTLAAASTSDMPAPAEGWENYQMLVADIDGDGRDDLAFNHRGTNNVVYVAMSQGDGSFAWKARKQHTNNGWGAYAVTVADVNGDGRDDLLWTVRAADRLRMYPGLAMADSSFLMVANFTDRLGSHVAYAAPVAARMDGNATQDVVFSRIGGDVNLTLGARFAAADSSFTFTTHDHQLSGWTGYGFRSADVDGQNADDLVFVKSEGLVAHIHRGINGGTGTYARPAVQSVETPGAMVPHVGDVNDDGRDDLILLSTGVATNDVLVGFGTGSGVFSFSSGSQSSALTPATGWASYDRVLVGDVNGDGKADVVWTNTATDARIYVARAK